MARGNFLPPSGKSHGTPLGWGQKKTQGGRVGSDFFLFSCFPNNWMLVNSLKEKRGCPYVNPKERTFFPPIGSQFLLTKSNQQGKILFFTGHYTNHIIYILGTMENIFNPPPNSFNNPFIYSIHPCSSFHSFFHLTINSAFHQLLIKIKY